MPDTDSTQFLDRELRGIFGARLRSLVAYGSPAPAAHDAHGHGPQPASRSMAVVESLTEQDLRACAARAAAWHAHGLATPLFVVAGELARSLDAFPLEFDAIAADHRIVSGPSPFADARVDVADLRRACEVQARSHLLHLREGFIEAAGNAHALAVLVAQSAAPLNALLASVARLEGPSTGSGHAAGDPESAARHTERLLGLTTGLAEVAALARTGDIAAPSAERLFPVYLAAVERLVEYVDRWQR